MLVLGKLGCGTYGNVYAVETPLGPCALKLIKQRANKSEHFGELLDSIREMYGLSTAGLLHGIVSHNDNFSFLMPMMGPAIGSSSLPLWNVPKAAAFLRSVAENLSKSKGLHRDIKSSNIVLPSKIGEKTTLLDFSLSTFADTSEDEAVTTLQYRAPEIIVGLEYGKPSDIWSFGMVLFNVLLGFHFSTDCTEDNKIRHCINLMNAFGWSDWPDFEDALNVHGFELPISRPPNGYFDFEIILSNFNNEEMTSCAGNLLRSILKTNPKERFTWQQILEHPFWSFADCSLIEYSIPKIIKMTSQESLEIASYLSTAKTNDSLRSANFDSYGPLNLKMREKFYTIDHMIYYGKKVNAKESTLFKAYHIWLHCFGLHNSDSSRKFGTELQDLAACLLLALSYNEDFRILACDKNYTWTKWALLFDAVDGTTFQFEAMRAMHLSKGIWPTAEYSERLATFRSSDHHAAFMTLGISELFMSIIDDQDFGLGVETIKNMISEVPRSIISVQ